MKKKMDLNLKTVVNVQGNYSGVVAFLLIAKENKRETQGGWQCTFRSNSNLIENLFFLIFFFKKKFSNKTMGNDS